MNTIPSDRQGDESLLKRLRVAVLQVELFRLRLAKPHVSCGPEAQEAWLYEVAETSRDLEEAVEQ